MTTLNEQEREAHDGWSFDLTTPRQYTARGGWNVHCACGTHIGESGDSDLAERHDRHVAALASDPTHTQNGTQA